VMAAAQDAAQRRAGAPAAQGLLAGSLLALPALRGAAQGSVVFAPHHQNEDEVLPGPSRLTRHEVMLYDPPQYRVRDNIYIH